MPEHKYIDGTLRQGYFCHHCGQSVNMVGTGHFVLDEWRCESNVRLVQQLIRANPPRGVKPHYVWTPQMFT